MRVRVHVPGPARVDPRRQTDRGSQVTRRVIPVVADMPLLPDWLQEVTDDADFSLRERSRLAKYPLEGTSGLAYRFGLLPGLATY